jgi:hypothetical protein
MNSEFSANTWPSTISAVKFKAFKIGDEYYSSTNARKVGGRNAITVFLDGSEFKEYICEINCFLVVTLWNVRFSFCKVKYFKKGSIPSHAKNIREAVGYAPEFDDPGLQDIIPVHNLLRRTVLVDGVGVMLPSKLRA